MDFMFNASIYNIRLHDFLAACVVTLMALGILMVQSASMRVVSQPNDPDQLVQASPAPMPQWRLNDYATRHVVYVGIALVTFLIVGHIDYRKLISAKTYRSNPVLLFLLFSALACFVVLIPGIGKEVNGARRWLNLGVTQVQPSELGKWAIVIFLAWWVSTQPIRIRNFLGFIFTLAPVGIICLMVVKEDFGTAALIALSAILILLIGRAKLWHLALVLPPIMAAGYWFVRHKEYRWKRIIAFLDPWAYPEKEGYHMIQSLMSFASGGLFGKGLGRGVQKLGYLPEDTTDFIFAVVCEELGLFGALFVIALYLGILFVAWNAMRSAKDSFGRLLAFGVGVTIAFQAIINVAVATVSMPTKGMSLPLVSYGGSGLVITSAALGLLYSVCRISHQEAPIPFSEVESKLATA